MSELIVALDYPSAETAEKTIQVLSSRGVVFKVGLELFISAGPSWVKKLTDQGHRVFLDLKLHDIPNTVAKATEQACALGVEFLTIHLAGGSEMIQGAIQAAQKTVQKNRKKTIILGVSVLTSFSEAQWSGVTQCVGGRRTVGESVDALVAMGVQAGLGGIVCSAQEVASLRRQYPALYTVVPGIRPLGADKQDQSRVVTPREAVARGASAIVVGRPITQAADPLVAVDEILQQMKS